MNPQEELRELIAQAKEHLCYYIELGLTRVGEISAPAAPEPKLEERVAKQAPPAPSALAESKRQEPPAPAIIPPP
ncbi:MAG: hypothetical protein J2P52_03660, partial [Blastocatellia bacterium]|nr:hypothetical protein [Blastocatellia bacterium]